MVEHGVHQLLAFGVGERELLGQVGEDADTVRAGVDDEVDGSFLALEIEVAAIVEDRGATGNTPR